MTKYLFISLLAFLTLVSCNKDKEEDEKKEEKSFDKEKMLVNYFDNVILSNSILYNTSLENLKASTGAFIASPELSSLEDLRSKFIITYKAYQGIKLLNFGPLENSFYTNSANIYPTDTATIKNNITSGSYSLGSASNSKAIGLAAIDYLLYAGGNSAVINNFTADGNAVNRKTYLNDVVTKLVNEFSTLTADWTAYRSDFISATGVDIGSSTGLMFNAYMKDVELFKNAKLGIPSGQQTGGMVLPTYVEGYYGGLSITLAIESCKHLQTFFNAAAKEGLDDFVRNVEGDKNPSLATEVNNQFDLIVTKLNSLNTSLSNEIEVNGAEVNQVYFETKKLVTYLKTDVASLLGILITYQDNDGD